MSWQDLLKLGKEQYEAGKYLDARTTLSDALAESKKESATEVELAEVKLELGKVCRLITAYDECLELLNDAAAVFKKSGQEGKRALALNFLGLLYQSLYQLDDSQKALDEALEIAERIYKNKHEDLGEILNSVGLLHWRRGDDKTSLEFYERALEIYRETIGEENDRFAETFDNMGVAYQRLGQLEKAVEHHTRSIAIREKCVGPKHPNIGYGLLNLASVKSRLGDEKDYEEMAKRAIAVFEEGFGPDNPDTSMAINNLGTYYLEKMRLDEALEKYNIVLQRREAVFGSDHPNLRLTFHNLATVHQLLGHKEEAKAFNLKGQALLKRTVQEEKGKNVDTIITLADSLQSSGQTEEAEQLLKDALAACEDGPDKNDSKAARILELLGAMNVTKSHETAKEIFFKKLKIEKRIFGKKHPNIAKTLRHLANCFAMQSDNTTVLILQAQARAIEFQNGMENPEEQMMSAIFSRPPADGEDDGTNKRILITMLRIQGKDEEADRLEDESLALRAAILGADSLEYADELRTLAMSHLNTEKSLEMLERVLEIQEGHSDTDVDDMLWTLQTMILSTTRLRDYDKTEKVLLKCVALEEERNGSDFWGLKGFLSQLETNAEKQKNSEAQERYKKRIEALRTPTEEEEEALSQKQSALLQARLQKAMSGLGSMFEGLSNGLRDFSGVTEESADAPGD